MPKEDDSTALAPSGGIFAMHEDRKGNFWIGSDFLTVMLAVCICIILKQKRLPDTKMTLLILQAYDTTQSWQHLRTSRGNFWVGTTGDGLHLMDRDKGSFTHFPYNPDNEQQLSGPYDPKFLSITAIQENAEGLLWIAGSGGVVIYNPQTESVSRIGSDEYNPNSLADYFVSKMLNRSNRQYLVWGR